MRSEGVIVVSLVFLGHCVRSVPLTLMPLRTRCPKRNGVGDSAYVCGWGTSPVRARHSPVSRRVLALSSVAASAPPRPPSRIRSGGPSSDPEYPEIMSYKESYNLPAYLVKYKHARGCACKKCSPL